MINNLVTGIITLSSLIYLAKDWLKVKSTHKSATQLTYTSWIVGDTLDVKIQPLGGVLLAGGSTDVDAAMR
ncbi:hypothetical protein [Spirosoma foliorum]|uniref:Uncharacterized protein n=1 Tax=Spirosoma foliorum TaxID=2710596 RepID=A0A7G5GX53_9BACT|nr:hypothetical protein [Spirosoma foliorum]QMW03445.1 hypothetical protein H3H32_00285 [Spirosoma foliorum]